MLTTFDLDQYVYAALAAGDSGFLLKEVAAERLFDAVRVVAPRADGVKAIVDLPPASWPGPGSLSTSPSMPDPRSHRRA